MSAKGFSKVFETGATTIFVDVSEKTIPIIKNEISSFNIFNYSF